MKLAFAKFQFASVTQLGWLWNWVSLLIRSSCLLSGRRSCLFVPTFSAVIFQFAFPAEWMDFVPDAAAAGRLNEYLGSLPVVVGALPHFADDFFTAQSWGHLPEIAPKCADCYQWNCNGMPSAVDHDGMEQEQDGQDDSIGQPI